MKTALWNLNVILPDLFTCELDEVCHLSYHTRDFQRDVAELIILKATS